MGKSKRKLSATDMQEQTVSIPCTNGKPKSKKKTRTQGIAKETEPPADDIVSPKSQQKHSPNDIQEQTVSIPSVPPADDFVPDKYRLDHEVDEHWELRRMFLEKNYHSLPEDELQCLAQVFMNIELLHCSYPPKTMARVAELSEGITSEYRRTRCNMLKRTVVWASNAAASKVQRKPLTLPAKDSAGPQSNSGEAMQTASMGKQLERFEPLLYPKNQAEALRNIVIVRDSVDETMRAYQRLGVRAKWMLETTTTKKGNKTCLKIGKYEIAQVMGEIHQKRLEKKAKTQAMEFLKKHCYTIVQKKRITEMDTGVTLVTKDCSEDNDTATETLEPKIELGKLDKSNVGFQLMQKLGWKGGSLGTRGNGLLAPVTTTLKIGRKGLGHENPYESERAALYARIKKLLIDLQNGVTRDHLVFAADFTKQERADIHLMGLTMGRTIKMQSFGSEKTGSRQLAAWKNQEELSPLQILNKVLIEKDAFYCEMYDVIPPKFCME